MDTSQLSISVAFVAGIVSFLSPCVLPLVPIYLAQLVGQSVYQATQQEGEQSSVQRSYHARLTTFLHAVMFVCGFTLAFVALGATASTLGNFLQNNRPIIREIGGFVLVLIGLHLTGVLKIPFLYWQKRFAFRPTRPSYWASLLIGLVFALGWTPCIGVILTPILGMAANAATLKAGVFLLLAYSLGLGVPFLLLGLGLNQISRILTWLKPHLGKIEVATGVVMMMVGILIFFNLLSYLNAYFNLGIST